MLELTGAENFHTLVNHNKVVLVDFYAEWCGPCKMLKPFLKELTHEIEDFSVVKVDVDNENLSDVVSSHNVSAMPTLCFYKDGKLSKTLVGFQSKEKLKNIIMELLD